MIIVATINMITALLILILERTQLIGTLKALGLTIGVFEKSFCIILSSLSVKVFFWGNIAGIGLVLIQFYFLNLFV